MSESDAVGSVVCVSGNKDSVLSDSMLGALSMSKSIKSLREGIFGSKGWF